MSSPPPLPRGLLEPRTPVLAATAAFGLVALVTGAITLLTDRALGGWFWTSAAGFLLGFVGLSIIYWQRSAARRGSRSAQSGLD